MYISALYEIAAVRDEKLIVRKTFADESTTTEMDLEE